MALWLAGSPGQAAETPEEYVEPELSDYDRHHWAYQPIARPALPAVVDSAWCRTPVDRFILSRLENNQLVPAREADRRTLARRLAYDLTGLPLEVDRIDAFVADESSDAYERLVDELLASPTYGQRWAQHWLDLARYAETDGFEHDKVRLQAWRYRDWVIDAFNRDMPLDEFIRQQIAGDLLYPDDEQAPIATGFLLCGPDMPDLNLQEERRHNVLNEVTSTVGAALLGLQLGCAQCHDHKYDALSQADFYRLRAVFETADVLPQHAAPRAVAEVAGKPVVSRLMVRGDFRRPGPVLVAGYPRVACTPAHDPGPKSREALAHWLASPDNPLAARVLVNRLWQYHFGQGLVATPSDFGVMGAAPTHPELLDWLACEMVSGGWQLKDFHRLLVRSTTYRLASRPSAPDNPQWRALVERDPENRLRGRFSRRRLEGEAIRDTLLWSAGGLDLRHGGPSVLPPLPTEMLATLLKDQWVASKDTADHFRRSIYVFVRRNLRYPLFDVHDRPDTNVSCPCRDQSTTASQALALLNSELVAQAATDLARFAARHAGDQPAAQARFVFRRSLGRPPTEGELTDAETLIQQHGLKTLCLAIFNMNEFVWID